MLRPWCLISLAVALTFPVFGQGGLKSVDYYPLDEWRTSPAARQGLDPVAIKGLYGEYGSKATILIIRNGYLIEGNGSAKPAEGLRHIHSCTKSVISLLYGMVFPAGRAGDLLVKHFPEYRRSDNQGVKISHLLSMSSGMQWSDIPNIDSNRLLSEKNWIGYIMAKPILAEPGTAWNYNSGGSQLISVITERELGYPLRDFAEERLFGPLGILDYQWWESNDGYLAAGWGLHLSAFDLSKIGYLVLRKGLWKGERILPEAWIKEFLTRRAKANADFSYGYQWWIYEGLPWDAYRAYGAYGDHHVFLILVPGLDLEIVIEGQVKDDVGILRKYLLPAAGPAQGR